MPRNIFAKFTFYKDHEFIRIRAPRKLNGSRVWTNEQQPPEIEDGRKNIYLIMRKAKKNGKKADGEVFTETQMDPRMDSQTFSQTYRTPVTDCQKNVRTRHLPQTVMNRDTRESN